MPDHDIRGKSVIAGLFASIFAPSAISTNSSGQPEFSWDGALDLKEPLHTIDWGSLMHMHMRRKLLRGWRTAPHAEPHGQTYHMRLLVLSCQTQTQFLVVPYDMSILEVINARGEGTRPGCWVKTKAAYQIHCAGICIASGQHLCKHATSFFVGRGVSGEIAEARIQRDTDDPLYRHTWDREREEKSDRVAEERERSEKVNNRRRSRPHEHWRLRPPKLSVLTL